MKPLKEEKIDLIQVRAPLKLLLSLLFLLPLQAQININNFCYYNSLSTSASSNKIIVYDYTMDDFPDIVLLNGLEKNVIEIKGENNLFAGKPHEKFFFYPISELKKLNYKEGSGDIFIFVSRKERICGLLSFTKYGTLQLLHQTTFDQYPEKIIVGDTDNDDKNEAIIFGSNFKGLVLLEEKDFVFHRKSIASDRVFSEAQFVDLDYDGFLDIVAYDLFAGKISFFYNDQEGNFFDYRELETTSVIKNLKVDDFNLDGYNDLLFHSGNELSIFQGDSVSSYSNKRIIEFDEELIDYEVADFNLDGLKDLAIIDSESNLKVKFSASADSLLEAITYFRKEGLIDLAIYNKGKKRGLIVLSENGELYSIFNYIMDKSKIQLSIGTRPSVINSFRYSDSYYQDICFLDNDDGKLKLLLRGNSGIFLKYMEILLSYDYSNIIIPKNQKPLTTFFFYTPGEKLIGRVQADLSTATYKKEKFYSYKPISEIRIEETREGQTAYALLYENNVVELKKYFFESESTVIEEADTLQVDVLNPTLAMGSTKKIFYWTSNEKSIQLKEQDLDYTAEPSVLFETDIDSSAELRLSTLTYSKDNLQREHPFGELELANNQKMYFYDGKKTSLLRTSKPGAKFLDRKDLVYYRTFQGKYRYIFSYEREGAKLYIADLNKPAKDISFNSLFENIYIDNFFVTELLLNEISLVFTDPIENCITIRKIE